MNTSIAHRSWRCVVFLWQTQFNAQIVLVQLDSIATCFFKGSFLSQTACFLDLSEYERETSDLRSTSIPLCPAPLDPLIPRAGISRNFCRAESHKILVLRRMSRGASKSSRHCGMLTVFKVVVAIGHDLAADITERMSACRPKSIWKWTTHHDKAPQLEQVILLQPSVFTKAFLHFGHLRTSASVIASSTV